MFGLCSYLWGLAAILSTSLLAWVVSLVKRDVSMVDSLWPMSFLLAAIVDTLTQSATGLRAALAVALVLIWSIRFGGYIERTNVFLPGRPRRLQAHSDMR